MVTPLGILASKRRKYTRRNHDPDLVEPVEDLEKIFKSRKEIFEQSISPLLETLSLPTKRIKTIDDIKFDLKFEYSLLTTK